MHLINYKPFPIERKNWHLSGLFSLDYISAPTGCWPLKFLHALGIDQGLLVHTPNRDRVPLKKIKSEYLKFGLKLSI